MEHEDKVLTILAAVSGVDRAAIHPEQDLVADLGIDSPKALRLLADLEDELNIEISDEAAALLVTVGDVLTHVRELG